MKEAVGLAGNQRTSGGGSGSLRSASEKERTKLRERQRRSITTKIFHGLRKHGGYPLSPRADINQVLRHLGQEAGWIIEPDGTTYRSPSSSSTTTTTTTTTSNVCPLCGTTKKSGTPTLTPTSSFLGATMSSGCGDSISDPTTTTTAIYGDHHPLVATFNMYGGGGGGAGGAHYISAAAMANQQGQGQAPLSPSTYMQLQWMEARASNENTPAGSPQRRT